MTSRDVVRTALVVGGIWLIFRSAINFATNAFIAVMAVYYSDVVEKLGYPSPLEPALLNIGLGLGFGFGSGIYAILSSNRWAAKLTASDESVLVVTPSSLLFAGLTILSVSIVASGVLAVVSALSTLLAELVSRKAMLVPAVKAFANGFDGIIAVALGALLFRSSGRIASRAA